MVFTASLLGAQQNRDSVENKPASLAVVFLGKILNEMPPFHAAASNLFSSTATGPDKVAYPMLKHLPRSGMDFLFHVFNLSWSSHFFPSIWKTSSIILIHKMGKPLDSPASFRPISLKCCVSKLFESIILSRLLFFLESNSILSLPARLVSALDGRLSIKFCTFLSPLRMGLTNPGRAFGRFSQLSISLKLLTLSGIPPYSTNLFRLASLLALLVELNLFFLTGALVWSFKIIKVVSFESVEAFRKDPFLALYFCLCSLMIFLLLCLLPSAAVFTLTIWLFGPPTQRALWTLVPRHLSSHSALSSCGLIAPLTLWRLSISLRPLVQILGSSPAFGAAWSSAMPPSLGSRRVTNNNNRCLHLYVASRWWGQAVYSSW